MADALVVTVKHRGSNGSAGAPTAGSTAVGELVWNGVDDKLYIGNGNTGSATSSEIIEVGGPGSFMTLSTTQTISGDKTFTNQVVISTGGSFTQLAGSFDYNVSGGSFEIGSGVTIQLSGNKILGLGTPTNDSDAATKGYVDGVAKGRDLKDSVRIASTSNLTLSGLSAIDGITPVAGDRILAKDQTTAADRGVYIAAAGAWTRAPDFDTSAEVTTGAYMYIEEGTTNGGKAYVLSTAGPITLGTTALTFSLFGGGTTYTAGAGLTLTGADFAVGAGTGITVGANDVALTGQALAFHNLATNGLVTRTGAATVTGRSIAGGTGITVTNGDGVAGNPTPALTGQALALHNLATNGVIVRTGSGTVAGRTIVETGNGIVITNGDGAAGNPSLALEAKIEAIANLTAASANQKKHVVIDSGGSLTTVSSLDAIGGAVLVAATKADARTALGIEAINGGTY